MRIVFCSVSKLISGSLLLDLKNRILIYFRKYWEYDEFEKGNIHKHCSTCYITNCQRLVEIFFSEPTFRNYLFSY